VFTGEHFVQGSGTNVGTGNPGPNAAKYLTSLYDQVTAITYQQLMESYFTPLLDSVHLTWNAVTNQPA
jgi:hypothetical protein